MGQCFGPLIALLPHHTRSPEPAGQGGSSNPNVVADDTGKVWDYSRQQKQGGSGPGKIDIVLDNAVFEFLADLVLAGYLLENCFATKVVVHGKRMPWSLSYVNTKDMEDLIQDFLNGTLYGDLDSPNKEKPVEAGKDWQHLIDSRRKELKIHLFWTTQLLFGRMPHVAPELYTELATADLVLFKRDFNYRKLTYDGNWPRTLFFGKALRPLAGKWKGIGMRILALRTCKADVCVGLGPGVEESPLQGWCNNGQYGVISYWDSKSS